MMGSKFSGKDRSDIVAGDILCAKSDGSKVVFDAADYASIPSSWNKIGIVVIPPSHDVYGTGEGAAVSLLNMSYNTPDRGSATAYSIYWGQDEVFVNRYFTRVNTTNNAANPTIGYDTHACLPSDAFADYTDKGPQCIADPIAYYGRSGSIYAPSPYLSDGSRNEDYYTTKYTENNALSDFDGIGNTNILCSLATAQSDWRTASTITNNVDPGYSPAACCCWRYHTVGTGQGDWYLPAAGELGYLIVRAKTIDNSISNVKGTTLKPFAHWSSTEHRSGYARSVNTNNGSVADSTKEGGYPVRSFIRF